MNSKGPIQIDLGIPSIFSTDVIVQTTIQESKDKKQKILMVYLIFIDPPTQKAVAKVTITGVTAAGLKRALEDSLKDMNKIISGKKKIRKQIQEESKRAASYTG